jgi:hypothetical protein
MKNIPIPAIVILVAISTFLLISCEDDKPETPAPNFEITSSDLLTVQETHENGWIKKAEHYTTDGTLQYEFTYHPNGTLEHYRVYKSTNNAAASAILYQEHTRSDTDLPLSSHYYDVAGNLYAELLYKDGLLASKIIYHTGTTTTFFYEQGAIQRIEKKHNTTDELTLITYTAIAGKRTIEITTAGAAPITASSTDHTIAQGFDISDDAFLLNLLDDKAEYAVTPVSHSGASSIRVEHSIDIQKLNINLVEYYALDDDLIQRFGTAAEVRKIKNLLSNDWIRSIAEQYPFTEGIVFIASSQSTINQHSVGGMIGDVMQATKSLRTQYGDDFEQLYGQGYITRYYHGKYLYTIGTLRNLPSDPTLRTKIEEIAEKRANDLVDGRSTVTEEELALLSHVFFQLKTHSNVLNVNGQVIESSAQYEALAQEVTNAESPIIQYVLARHFFE